MTVYWPLTMTGAGRLVVQTGEARLVVDCKAKAPESAGQVKTIPSDQLHDRLTAVLSSVA